MESLDIGVDGGVTARELRWGDFDTNERAFESIEPDRKIKVLLFISEITMLALDRHVSSPDENEEELAVARACFTAFYSCRNKGEYPLGSDGKPGVHSDVLTALGCHRFAWCSPMRDAMLAQQFMTHHTRAVVDLRGKDTSTRNSSARRAMAAAHRCVASRALLKLPETSQRLLEDWRLVFLAPEIGTDAGSIPS